MRITYLVEDSSRIWGGVKAVFDAANELQARGHDVTIVSKSDRPGWMELECAFVRSPSFDRADIPESDVVVATYWTTVPVALAVDRGAVVHYCQGYEGDNPECASHRARIEQVYRIPETSLVTISGHLRQLLKEKFDRDAHQVTYAIDHRTMFAGDERPCGRPVRVGLVGPYEIAWKDIRTGLEACQLAARAGLELQLVRVTNTQPHPDESNLGIPVEWHSNVPPAGMGEIYRSLDVFLGTSRGKEEGFFLPAVEAMACGVPSVLTEIPCFKGYGDNQYALFVDPKSPAQMAEALVIASGHAQLRGELRQNGIDTAARYHLDAHVDDLEATFADIARQPSAIASQDSVPRPRISRAGAEESRLSLGRTARETAATCTRLDELERAAHELEATVQAEFAHRRGLMLYAEGRFEAAAEALYAALASTTVPAEVYNDYGVAVFACGDRDAACAAFEQSLSLDPTHVDARANLAECRAV